MSSHPGDTPDPLGREIESALEGMNLQEIDMPERSSGASSDGGGRGGRREERLHKGTIVGVNGDDVIVELGPRMQGVISSNEFEAEPQVGEVYDFSLRGKEKDSDLYTLSRKEALTIAKWNEIEVGHMVKAKVTGQNTGGLELKVGPLPAFMPASQVDVKHVEDLSTKIGEGMLCEVLEVDRKKKRVVLSRRRVLDREREEQRAQTMETLSSGQVVRGKVSRMEPFGAFVEIAPGVEGLLHVSNISRKRVEKPDEKLELGQTVEVMILDIKEGGKRIGLGMKQLEPNPWDDIQYRHPVDSILQGKVVRLMDFGAFVEIEEGIEGLLHVSQMARDRVNRPSDVVKVGEEFPVRIQGMEPERERISLTRLDPRGAVLGSEEAADAESIDQMLKEQQAPSGTNLGALFKKALENK